MRKPDDSSLTPGQQSRIRAEAKRALDEACALGIFPTPIADIMRVARVEEVKENVLNESFLLKIRATVKGTGQLLKSALSKVLGLFHASEGLIFIEQTLHEVKKSFIRLHECAHGFLPWQRTMYAVVEDCEKSLDSEVADTFDREANTFASEVLFQLDTFIEEANSKPFDIFTPVQMSKKYGSSVYSAVRQYVSKNHRSCVVVVLNPPVICASKGFQANVRRVVCSPSFLATFGELSVPDSVSPDDKIGALVPIGGRKASGKRNIVLVDRNGVTHECVAEAFTQTYQVFVLICVARSLTRTTIILPKGFSET